MSIVDDLKNRPERNSRFRIKGRLKLEPLDLGVIKTIDKSVSQFDWKSILDKRGSSADKPSDEVIDALIFVIVEYLTMKKIMLNEHLVPISKIGERARKIEKNIKSISSKLKFLASDFNAIYAVETPFAEWSKKLDAYAISVKEDTVVKGSKGTHSNEPLHLLIDDLSYVYHVHIGKPAPHKVSGGNAGEGTGPFLRLIVKCLEIAGDSYPNSNIANAIEQVLGSGVIKDKILNSP